MENLNWLGVILATVSTFALGGLWYSPLLFGKKWQQENKLTDEQLKGNQLKVFGLSFIWSFVMSFNLGMFLNDKSTNISWGLTAGFLAGFGWVAMAIFIIGLFERKSWLYMLINAGYMTVSFVVMGLIIASTM